MGDRVTKYFIVNLSFMIHAIPCRYRLIRYCILIHRKQFCNKGNSRYEKKEYLVKTLYLSGEISYVGRVVKCFIV